MCAKWWQISRLYYLISYESYGMSTQCFALMTINMSRLDKCFKRHEYSSQLQASHSKKLLFWNTRNMILKKKKLCFAKNWVSVLGALTVEHDCSYKLLHCEAPLLCPNNCFKLLKYHQKPQQTNKQIQQVSYPYRPILVL